MGVVVNVVCLGCQPRGCCLGVGGAVRTFFRVGAFFVVSVYSRFPIGGGEYKRLFYPRRFPIDVEWYREDGCVFIFRVSSVKLARDEPIIYVSAELFRG